MISLLTFGFLLGIRHALEADHIATVASLASSHTSRHQMMRQGFAWGIGHSLTLLLFGSVVLWMDTLISARLASALEMAVGVMMVLLGADVIRRAIKSRIHFHAHNHGEKKHFHAHRHTHEELQHHDSAPTHQHSHPKSLPLRALLMGLIHGMAGSAVLILLFIDRTQNVWQGILSITLFSIGSMVGMLLFSLAISLPLGITAKKLTTFHHGLQVGIGLTTIGLGLLLLVREMPDSVLLSLWI
ncbi:MAG: high frequency lysogenization protein HflD [Porticoccus sp.]|nr:high frequency lysogenization protein HflD [Porticoccus sp.]